MLSGITQDAQHIYLACGYTDFRKQIDGLCNLIGLQFKLDAYASTCVFIFCNKKRNCIKALRFEGNGFLMATKKLMEGMSFQWPKGPEELKDISGQQVRWLLEGLEIEQKKAHKPVVIQVKKTCY